MSGSWASPQELSAVFDRLETWSQIVLEEVISPTLYKSPNFASKYSKEIVHIVSSFFQNPLAFFFSPWYYY